MKKIQSVFARTLFDYTQKDKNKIQLRCRYASRVIVCIDKGILYTRKITTERNMSVFCIDTKRRCKATPTAFDDR